MSKITGDLDVGSTASVPGVESSDLNDGDIIAATATLDAGGGSYIYAITLPSGRELRSAPVGADFSKFAAISGWLDAVRAAIVDDAAEAGRVARDRQLAEARATDKDFTARSADEPAPGRNEPATRSASSDPTEYAKQQLRAALERFNELAGAKADVERWSQVVEMLTGTKKPLKKRRRKKKKVVQV